MIVNLADGAFTYKELLEMEEEMIVTLDFNITVPTSLIFLQQYLLIHREHPETKLIENCAYYFLESLLFDVDVIHVLPQHQAVCAYYATCLIFDIKWSSIQDELCQLQPRIIRKKYLKYLHNVLTASKNTIKSKYSSDKYNKIVQHISN